MIKDSAEIDEGLQQVEENTTTFLEVGFFEYRQRYLLLNVDLNIVHEGNESPTAFET